MGTLIEMLANQKKPKSSGEIGNPLPILSKAHEGSCGDGCGCDASEGCCSG